MAENTAPTVVTEAPTEYIPEHFEIKMGDKLHRFTSIPKEVTRTPKGEVKPKKMTIDYFVPLTTDIPSKLESIGWVARLQEEREAGAGIEMLDSIINRLADAPNEVILKDDGTHDYNAFLTEYAKPLKRTGVSEGKVKKEMEEAMKQLGNLFWITRDPDPASRTEKMRAEGLVDNQAVLLKMDNVQTRISKLSNTLNDIRERKAEREAKKKQKELEKEELKKKIEAAKAQPAPAAAQA